MADCSDPRHPVRARLHPLDALTIIWLFGGAGVTAALFAYFA